MTASASANDAVDHVDQTIGYNVHGLLYRRKNSQKELALVLGVTPSVLSKKLRGESSWSARQIAATAQFLDLDPGKLFVEPTRQKITRKLAAITGGGVPSQMVLPLLHRVSTGVLQPHE